MKEKTMKRLVLSLILSLLAADVFSADALTAAKRTSWLNSFLSGGGIGAEPFAADPVACSSNWTRRRYYNTASNVEYVCDGTAWRAVSLIGSTGTAGTITAADIATGAVATAEILNETILSEDIFDGTIVAADIATGGVATAEILNGTILNEDIDATAAIARSKLAEDALQVYGIPISALQQTTGIGLAAGETAGNFDITVGTNTILANGEVTDNETEVSVAYFQFILPPEYVSAGDVTIRLPAALIKTGAPTDNGSTLDIEVYEQSDAGAVGSDICATAAATFAALDTWYNKDFVVTATGLVAGDVLNVKITASVIDSEAGAGTIVLNLAPPKVLIDIKG